MKKSVLSFMAITLLTVFSCEKEELKIDEENLKTQVTEDNPYQDVSPEEAMDFLKSSKLLTPVKEQNSHQKGIKRFRPKPEEMFYKPFTNIEGNTTVIPVESDYENTESEIIMMKINGKLHGSIIHKVRNEQSDEETFSGLLIITDLKRKFLTGYVYEKDILIRRLAESKNDGEKGLSNKKDAQHHCTICIDDEDGGGGSGGGSGSGGGGSGSDDNPIELEEVVVYADTPYVPVVSYSDYGIGTTTYQPVNQYNLPQYTINYGNGTGSNTNGTLTQQQIWEEFMRELRAAMEDRIKTDDPSVTDCLKNIIGKLQTKDSQFALTPDGVGVIQRNTLSTIILDLFESSQKYDITFKIDEAGSDINGNPLNGFTRRDPNNIHNHYIITIDDDLIENGTQLAIARTVMHESLHAYANYIVDERNLESNYFLELQNLYQKYKDDEKAENMTQHEFISQFVDMMGKSLRVWDNKQLDLEYYKMLAWGGLETSPNYNSLTETEKTKIQDALKNERTGNNKAKGNTKCQN